MVEVRRSDTHEPVVGALMIAQSSAKDHPLSVDSILGKTGPLESRGMTGADGRATVEIVEDRYVRIGVVAPQAGAAMAFAGFDASDARWNAWKVLAPNSSGDAAAASLELRVSRQE